MSENVREFVAWILQLLIIKTNAHEQDHLCHIDNDQRCQDENHRVDHYSLELGLSADLKDPVGHPLTEHAGHGLQGADLSVIKV